MSFEFTCLQAPELTYDYNRDTMTFTAKLSFLVEVTEGTTTTTAGDPVWEDLASNRIQAIVQLAPSEDFNPADWEEGATHSTIPETVTLLYWGSTIDGSESLPEVTCYLASKRVTDTPTHNVVRVDATYAGRVRGTHKVAPRSQMTSVRQPHSLDTDADGDHIGIGPDFEGVSRHMPINIMQVTEVVHPVYVATRADNAVELGGSVNEDDWASPWNVTYDEGSWVYMGISASNHDRRTGTVELIHEFMRRGDISDQQIHRWFGYKRKTDPAGEQIKMVFDDTVTTAQFLPIAGTDEWWDSGSTIPEWGTDLDLFKLWS
jgi:hypothetical protein